MARLSYGTIKVLEGRIKELEAKLANLQSARMLKEEVDAEDVAEIVSKWTHIPISKLMEAEVQKLLNMEDRLRERVVGRIWLCKSFPTLSGVRGRVYKIPIGLWLVFSSWVRLA